MELCTPGPGIPVEDEDKGFLAQLSAVQDPTLLELNTLTQHKCSQKMNKLASNGNQITRT